MDVCVCVWLYICMFACASIQFRKSGKRSAKQQQHTHISKHDLRHLCRTDTAQAAKGFTATGMYTRTRIIAGDFGFTRGYLYYDFSSCFVFFLFFDYFMLWRCSLKAISINVNRWGSLNAGRYSSVCVCVWPLILCICAVMAHPHKRRHTAAPPVGFWHFSIFSPLSLAANSPVPCTSCWQHNFHLHCFIVVGHIFIFVAGWTLLRLKD